MKMDETEYTELYMELEKYEKRGDGNIETLRFTDINEHFRAEITP